MGYVQESSDSIYDIKCLQKDGWAISHQRVCNKPANGVSQATGMISLRNPNLHPERWAISQ